MTPCRRIARRCLNTPDQVVRLAGVKDPVALCSECVAAARALGMDPKPVPQWLARGVTGEAHGVDRTGVVMAR